MPDKAGGAPGRARGDRVLLQEHDIGLMVARKMVGRGAADDTAADDDDGGVRGQGHLSEVPYLVL